ncbi:hypothetical protein PL373_18525 [Tenacibaculum maritimum]|nr:hypothetical protein [Tenacibaculum maritimum]MDB0603085.1 hypothetical protein [Tenacibaculum maritimum]MDB0611655.1 hypothetical protein [Tenacibaculum maritimum]
MDEENRELNINIKFDKILNTAINFGEDSKMVISPEDKTIVNHKNIGIVYFIYLVNKKETKTELVYIGKSKGYLFKSRIRHHFLKKHPKTGSKLSLIQKELKKGNDVKLKFLKIKPESFRNTLEEELINHFRPEWNIQKKKLPK